jgi:alkyl sulfatase BDS1-like metallo-beta-lactamase superfamily hydrolase
MHSVDLTPPTPTLAKVTDGVYCGTAYGAANTLLVLTSQSVVVVDTTNGLTTAHELLRQLREISSLPVSYIIYSHHHRDHTQGAGAFLGPQTRIIAHRLLPTETEIQRASSTDSGYVPPDITVGERHSFVEGGVDFELFHAPGETVDHLIVWVPEQGVVFSGDIFQPHFPLLSSPEEPDRPVAAWARSVEHIRDLQPAHLVPGHGRPLNGIESIGVVLANYERAIRHVHDETVRCINAGRTIEEAVDEVRLPGDLSVLPYLQETHGKVSWAVRGLFRQYTGWYTFNPTDLNAHPAFARHRMVLQACGGPPAILEQAQWALDLCNYQLVLELTEIVLSVKPDQPRATKLRAAALAALSAQTANDIERRAYDDAAKPTGVLDE